MSAPSRRRDLRLAAVALLLLALPAAWFLWSSSSARERREATLAGVPEFPAPDQAPRHGPATPRRPPGRPAPAPATPAPPPQQPRADAIASFVLAPASSVALVQVNALFNTPLFDRLRACMPAEFAQLDEGGRELGIDLTRDVDRIAMVPGGVAISGFFEGKPIAQAMLGTSRGEPERREYRGQTLFVSGGRCTAQLGNLVVVGSAANCESLVDRALNPAPADAASELYGDVFLRSDMAALRQSAAAPEVRQLIDALDGMTVRANVWDSVALTVEGTPRDQRAAGDLAQMARGAISVIKGQLDDDDVELRALADLAEVQMRGDRLEMNLALPAQDLFDRLHFPCEPRDR